MLSISFETLVKDKVFIEIETKERKILPSPIDIINALFNEIPNKKYLIIIEGVGGTVDKLIEETRSQNHVLIDNGYQNFLVKKLPTLYLLTDNQEDIDVFKSYIGAFSEGYMSLFIINGKEELILSPTVSGNNVKDFIEKNSMIEISIASDSNIFEVQSNSKDILLHLCNKVCLMMLAE